jgi:cytochrome c553
LWKYNSPEEIMRHKRLTVLTSLLLFIAQICPIAAISETEEENGELSGQTTEDLLTAKKTIEEAIGLEPNMDNGRRIYVICASCHEPEGWGTKDGYYPQIAGQLPSILIKQIADIRAANRDNPTMYPFTLSQILPTPQDVADVAAYVARLPMTRNNGQGPGTDLEHGKKIYEEYCKECHGDNGEGDESEQGPLIQGQHYDYLVRQFEWIRDGKRRNADPDMVEQIEGFTARDIEAQMDYISRIKPPSERLADENWRNPDFRTYVPPPATSRH